MEIELPATARPCALVTFDSRAGLDLAVRLRTHGTQLGPVVCWGDHRGYALMQQARPPLILLDAPRSHAPADLGQYVRRLCSVGQVVVLADDGFDTAALLDAGAYDVVDRFAPTVETNARIQAHVRRLSPVQTRVAAGAAAEPPRPPEDFLVTWISRRRSAFCCHDLRVLLGSPGRPLDIKALRARLRNAEPILRQRRLRLTEHRHHRWITYTPEREPFFRLLGCNASEGELS
jgi:hypothetical protein